MFFKGVFVAATALATDPLVDDFFAQSRIFVSNADLNDYSHVFSDDESLPTMPSDSAVVDRKKKSLYSERHMEIVKELADGRTIKKGRDRFVDELFWKAEDRFKKENLISMNERTFARYLGAYISKKGTSCESSASRARSHLRTFYTPAHDAIVKEVVRRSIDEKKLSKKTAFLEVSQRFKAENLEPISRGAFYHRFNNIVGKETNMFSDLRA